MRKSWAIISENWLKIEKGISHITCWWHDMLHCECCCSTSGAHIKNQLQNATVSPSKTKSLTSWLAPRFLVSNHLPHLSPSLSFCWTEEYTTQSWEIIVKFKSNTCSNNELTMTVVFLSVCWLTFSKISINPDSEICKAKTLETFYKALTHSIFKQQMYIFLLFLLTVQNEPFE